MQRVLADLKATVRSHSEALTHVQKIADANFRRCGELQHEIDRLKKLLQ